LGVGGYVWGVRGKSLKRNGLSCARLSKGVLEDLCSAEKKIGGKKRKYWYGKKPSHQEKKKKWERLSFFYRPNGASKER